MARLIKLNDLTGYHLKARDGEIGKLQQIFFDDRRWVVRYLVVRTGNWLLGREVLLLPKVISAVSAENRQIEVDLSRQQIEESPPVDEKKPLSRHYELQYHRYYGFDPYWQVDPFYAMASAIPPPVAQDEPEPPEHPHLRSSAEVCGYRIHASDGEVGHVEDFILADQDWSIPYLEIDTGSFFFGNKILLAPAWLEQIDWAAGVVRVKLSVESLKTAPEYDEAKPINPVYQHALEVHYEQAQKQT